MLALGTEVGILSVHLQQALLEEQTRAVAVPQKGFGTWLAGPQRVAAERVISGAAGVHDEALTYWMEDGELLTIKRRYPDSTAWEARRGAMASLRRSIGAGGKRYTLARAREIVTRVVPVDTDRAHVRIVADLSNTRREHLAGAAGMAVTGSGFTAVAITLGIAIPFALVPIPLGLALGFSLARARRRGVERMQTALEQILDRLEHGEIEIPPTLEPPQNPLALQSPRTTGTPMSDINRVGVLGCGLMGSGIAQVAAAAGYQTVVRDVSDALNEKGRGRIIKSLDKAVEKGKLEPAARDLTLDRLTFTTAVADLEQSDVIIEAVTEDLDAKNTLWQELDSLSGADTIFASNTSSLTIAAMAAVTQRADRFVGLHFFNPVPIMKLVEVVRTVTTSPATFDRAMAFAASLGKKPIAAKDTSGFIVNLLLVPYLLDAIRAVEGGVGSIPDIDQGMVLGTGYPMGPFTLLDFVGLDTTFKIAEIMFDEYREKRYAPPPLLKRMVLAGMYGKKSGKGFYDYSSTPPAVSDLGL